MSRKSISNFGNDQRNPALPQILFLLIIAAFILWALYDYNDLLNRFKHLIRIVQDEPLKASIVIILLYIVLIVFSLPIVFISVPLGYSFHKAFEEDYCTTILRILMFYRWVPLWVCCLINWNNFGWCFSFYDQYGFLNNIILSIGRYLMRDLIKRRWFNESKMFAIID